MALNVYYLTFLYSALLCHRFLYVCKFIHCGTHLFQQYHNSQEYTDIVRMLLGQFTEETAKTWDGDDVTTAVCRESMVNYPPSKLMLNY
jgi:hypothetical protein